MEVRVRGAVYKPGRIRTSIHHIEGRSAEGAVYWPVRSSDPVNSCWRTINTKYWIRLLVSWSLEEFVEVLSPTKYRHRYRW